MTKVNSLKSAFLFLALVGLINLSYAQTRCGGHNSTPTGCTGFKTYTQGGWGSNSCSNSNSTPGNLLKNNFASLFPNGLEIGCTRKLKLTSANAVATFLPSGGTPSSLPAGTLTNPTSSYKNTLAGQLVAAVLNVRFDDGISSFGQSSSKLKDLIIASGPFSGWTVQQLIDEANKKIGSCSVSTFTFSQFNEELTKLNENYDNGNTNKNFLNCPPACSNVTIGGAISGNEANCGGFDPAEIASSTAASGGIGTIEYSWFSSVNGSDWTLISGATSATFNPSAISSTTYYRRSAKRNTCPAIGATSNVIVKTVNSSPSASITGTTDVLCFQGTTGSVNLAVSGGTPTYSFAWDNGSTSEDLSGVSAGTYTVVVTDANGCKSNASATVNSPSSAVSASANGSAVNCFGDENGSVDLTVSGGTAGYSFAWDNSSTSEDLSGLGAGSYSVIVTDANGCQATASATVTGPSAALSASAETTSNVLCFGGSTGMIALSVNGGTKDYSFLWSNGATTQNLSGVAKGDYNVTITDANGCTTTSSASVTEPAALNVTGSLTKASACNCNGTATLDVTGGTPSYTYLWSNGSTDASVSSLCLGQNVSVTVTDANGCTFSDYSLGTVDMVRGCVPAEIIENRQAKQNNGGDVPTDRSNPAAMYGTPDGVNAAGGYFSLGFGGWVVLKLDGAITDQPGNDLKVFETTFNNRTCSQYPEYARVAVSPDNVNWTDLGIVCQDGELDIAPAGACINYVKLTDVSNAASFNGQIADGYDVDGIKCIAPASFGRAAVSSESSDDEGSAHWISRSVSLFPNPADSKLSLELTGGNDEAAIHVTIVNHVGQVVKSFDVTAGAGQFRMDIPVEDLARGIYNVSIKGGDLQYNQKVIKK